MAYDFKKEQKQFYKPGKKPEIIEVPKMNCIAVRGKGDPNQEDSEYKKAIQLLYGVAYTIKMSKKSDHQIKDYFDFVVPPLEGLWWQENTTGIDYAHKENFEFISMIRMPEFVTQEVFDWAIEEASKKKDGDFSEVELITLEEGKCVQVMHVGSYDDEPATIEKMKKFAEQNGLTPDYSDARRHHEIYLSDPRRTKVENLKTVIRIPVK
ncbi:GyrI-like domain-containing protein [uncultured Lactobacillus sp.]|uniref:GyrI-like domain-containing protein n=1 Tax=uncultured Lactobacillus sp. TaxID=153152 RepID=UPI0028041DE8|nr:GyrI-like domain-containing protein [uncultured Lactobacillus sp.]